MKKIKKSNFIIEIKPLNLYNKINSYILIQKGFGNMLGIDVKKTNEELIISWQLAEITIPLRDVIRIGTSYGTTDRILIKTVKQNYVLFTTNKVAILNAIHA